MAAVAWPVWEDMLLLPDKRYNLPHDRGESAPEAC